MTTIKEIDNIDVNDLTYIGSSKSFKVIIEHYFLYKKYLFAILYADIYDNCPVINILNINEEVIIYCNDTEVKIFCNKFIYNFNKYIKNINIFYIKDQQGIIFKIYKNELRKNKIRKLLENE